ncbi:uncharacterized protein V1518DRAFT_457381 [Limtongia smithiae]|uniref:uncharacterized protein n=1 Tax=Limtongia smithiae TaxID=1125753 RepID=UPI0034CFABEB
MPLHRWHVSSVFDAILTSPRRVCTFYDVGSPLRNQRDHTYFPCPPASAHSSAVVLTIEIARIALPHTHTYIQKTQIHSCCDNMAKFVELFKANAKLDEKHAVSKLAHKFATKSVSRANNMAIKVKDIFRPRMDPDDVPIFMHYSPPPRTMTTAANRSSGAERTSALAECEDFFATVCCCPFPFLTRGRVSSRATKHAAPPAAPARPMQPSAPAGPALRHVTVVDESDEVYV